MRLLGTYDVHIDSSWGKAADRPDLVRDLIQAQFNAASLPLLVLVAPGEVVDTLTLTQEGRRVYTAEAAEDLADEASAAVAACWRSIETLRLGGWTAPKKKPNKGVDIGAEAVDNEGEDGQG